MSLFRCGNAEFELLYEELSLLKQENLNLAAEIEILKNKTSRQKKRRKGLVRCFRKIAAKHAAMSSSWRRV